MSTRSGPTDSTKPSERQSSETRPEKSTEIFTSTKILLKPPIESVVVGKRLPPLQIHAIEWVRDWG